MCHGCVSWFWIFVIIKLCALDVSWLSTSFWFTWNVDEVYVRIYLVSCGMSVFGVNVLLYMWDVLVI